MYKILTHSDAVCTFGNFAAYFASEALFRLCLRRYRRLIRTVNFGALSVRIRNDMGAIGELISRRISHAMWRLR